MTAFLTPEEGLGSSARSLPLVHTSLRKAALDTPHLTVLCLLRAEIPRATGQLRPPVPSLSCLPRATFIYLSTALAHGLSPTDCPHGEQSEQGAGEVAALPAQAGGLGVFVQVAGLAEPLAALEAGVGLFPRVNSDVLLTVCQSQEGLTADFAGILSSPLYNQDIVL